MFKAQGRFVRFVVDVPAAADERFKLDGRKTVRTPEQRQKAAQAEERRLWRALLLCIKAKLEVVESGIASFEQEFLAFILLPDQTTVGDWVTPQVAAAYESGEMPPMLALPAGPGK